jgi:O-acetyl-ADP-ribose deacetylase (regulator of RNase III)
MIEYVVGDLIASDEPVIAHGCNTVGVMGAGIARVVRSTWPEVYYEYETACARGTFDAGSAQRCKTPEDRVVYNLGTQRNPGAGATYWLVFLSFANMLESMKTWGHVRVAVPRIGCGIGGLEWSGVEAAIEAALDNVTGDFEIVVYTHPSDADKVWR